MKPKPQLIAACYSQRYFNEAQHQLINRLEENRLLGYEVPAFIIHDILKNGMTMQTFNMLVAQLNDEIYQMYENAPEPDFEGENIVRFPKG